MDVTTGDTTVSVVIPCFNHARFLGEAIESALAQEQGAVEVIVVDDGSTDGSGDVAVRYPGVRVVRQANGGLSSARNAGLQAASGEVIIFLDADDRLMPYATAAAFGAFERHDAAMVFGRCELIDAEGRPLPTNVPGVVSDYFEELLVRNYIWMPAMAAFRRRVLHDVGGFDPRVNASADYDMYLRVARSSPIASHGAVVAQYRQHGANMSADPVLMLDTTLSVLRAQRPYVSSAPALEAAWIRGESQWREFYGERLVDRFRASLHDGRRLDALRDAGQLLRLYPAGVRRHLRKKAALVCARAASPSFNSK